MPTKRKNNRYVRTSHQLEWLPIDSRLIPDIIRFSHVHGVSRVFLVLEIILTTFVVFGTFLLAIIKITSGA
jgi:hypothetical protein